MVVSMCQMSLQIYVQKKAFTSRDKGKIKVKGKGKKNASVKKEGEKLTCKHFSKEGHDEDSS